MSRFPNIPSLPSRKDKTSKCVNEPSQPPPPAARTQLTDSESDEDAHESYDLTNRSSQERAGRAAAAAAASQTFRVEAPPSHQDHTEYALPLSVQQRHVQGGSDSKHVPRERGGGSGGLISPARAAGAIVGAAAPGTGRACEAVRAPEAMCSIHFYVLEMVCVSAGCRRHGGKRHGVWGGMLRRARPGHACTRACTRARLPSPALSLLPRSWPRRSLRVLA